MTTVSFKLTGAEALKEVLEKLPGEMQDRVLKRSLRKGAQIIRDEISLRAPVKTGVIKKGIMIRENKKTRESAEMQVAPVSKAFYAMFYEFGKFNQPPRPFMRPAFDAKKEDALKAIGQEMGVGIDQQAKKLAGDLNKSGLVKRGKR